MKIEETTCPICRGRGGNCYALTRLEPCNVCHGHGKIPMIPAENPKDVHTEHCCLKHGCKYDNVNCTVTNEEKTQSFPCQDCQDESTLCKAVFDGKECGHELTSNVHHCSAQDDNAFGGSVNFPCRLSAKLCHHFLKESLPVVITEEQINRGALWIVSHMGENSVYNLSKGILEAALNSNKGYVK